MLGKDFNVYKETPEENVVWYCDAVIVQRGAAVHPKRTGGVVGAVFSEMSGERSPGSGPGGREAGPQAVSERESRAECSQPGHNPLTSNLHVCWIIQIHFSPQAKIQRYLFNRN